METKETMYERCCKVMPPVAGRYTTLGVVKGEGSYSVSYTHLTLPTNSRV